MSSDSFETTRLITIIAVIGLRLSLIRPYLQSYLNVAPQKLSLMKRESGRITNLDLQRLVLLFTMIVLFSNRLFRQISRVFSYLCVVSLQYITPLFICLFMTLILKTLGSYCWTSYVWGNWEGSGPVAGLEGPQTGPQLTLLLFRQVFNPVVLRGLMGFMVWWLCSVWFATNVIGFVYHSYFS